MAPPPSDVISIVVIPTRSETRAPWTTRLQTSRPNSSVPRTLAALGGRNRSSGWSRVGLGTVMASAKTAASTKASSSAVPRTTARLRASPSLIPDAGINEGIHDIDAEVDEDVRRRRDEDDPLHDGIVTTQDGGHDESAQPRNVEDDLGH